MKGKYLGSTMCTYARKIMRRSDIYLETNHRKNSEIKKKVSCAFVDLEKTFNTLDGSKLWEVLKEYGVNGLLLKQ